MSALILWTLWPFAALALLAELLDAFLAARKRREEEIHARVRRVAASAPRHGDRP